MAPVNRPDAARDRRAEGPGGSDVELGPRDGERVPDAGLHIHEEGADVDPGYQGAVAYEQLEESTEHEDLVTGETASVEDAVVAFVEAFNARDLDSLLDLMTDTVELPDLGSDLAGFERAVEECWDRNPSVTATAGQHDDNPVVVLWTADNTDWCVTGVLTIEATDSGIVLAELIDQGPILEDVSADTPEHERNEGAVWEEWEEGVPGQ